MTVSVFEDVTPALQGVIARDTRKTLHRTVRALKRLPAHSLGGMERDIPSEPTPPEHRHAQRQAPRRGRNGVKQGEALARVSMSICSMSVFEREHLRLDFRPLGANGAFT